MIHRATT